jgi:hypothetical protein
MEAPQEPLDRYATAKADAAKRLASLDHDPFPGSQVFPPPPFPALQVKFHRSGAVTATPLTYSRLRRIETSGRRESLPRRWSRGRSRRPSARRTTRARSRSPGRLADDSELAAAPTRGAA